MTDTPLITVVLPVYNGATFIVEAVGSILAQTYTSFELRVIDDGSTDASRDLLASIARSDPRLIVHARPHGGLVATLNFGIAAARGRYIARMDADDIALPGRFAAQVAHLDQHLGCVAVGTGIIKVDETGAEQSRSGRRRGAFNPTAFPPSIPGIAHPTAMMRTDALRAVGGYRPYFTNAEDRDLWARLWQIGTVDELAGHHLRYRVHAGSITRQKRVQQLQSTLMADLSAVCREMQIDDQAILDRTAQSGDQQSAIDAYAALIGQRYPTETLRMYRCIRNRMWAAAPFTSHRGMITGVARHIAADPFEGARLKLLYTAIRHGMATQRH